MTQTELPFWLGDSNAREGRALWLSALKVVDADCHLARFVERVFDSPKDDGWVRRSCKEMSEAPDWLLCGLTKVRQTVERAESLGLVKVDRRQNQRGAKEENGYAIDWQGIKHLLGITSIATQPTSIATQPTPIATQPTSIATQPTPIATQPTPIATQPTPIATQPTPIATQPTPVGPEHGECSSTNPIPLACVRAPTVQTDLPPPSAAHDGEEVKGQAHAICRAFWPKPPPHMKDRRDQRLIYRLAVLALDEHHGDWIKQLISETIDKKPEIPFAMLQSLMAKLIPSGWTPVKLLCSIDVPRWALCDPRDWCPNGETRQQE